MTTENENLIGKPNYDGGGTKKDFSNFNWKVTEEGPNVYRPLPPFSSLAKAGYWSKYEAIHWGFKTSDGKHKPFRCVQRKNFKTKMIEVACPMCKKIAEQRATHDSRKKSLEAEKKTKEEINTLLMPLSDWLKAHNVQKGHFINALRPDMKIGRLFLKITAKQALDARIEEARKKKNIDPIDIDGGLWFDFKRTGTGATTSYTVDFVSDERNVEGVGTVSVLRRAPLTPELLTRMATEAFDLTKSYRDLTVNEVEALVNSGGDVTIVDSVFGNPTVKTTSVATPMEEPEMEEEEVSAPEMATKTPTLPEPTVTEGEVDPEEAALVKQILALQAKKRAGKSETAPTPTTNNNMSDDDFIASFKAGKTT